MKKIIIPFLLLFLLAACSQKTHIAESLYTTNHARTVSDSVSEAKTQIIDKTLTTITRDIDTIITTAGKPLTGHIGQMNHRGLDSTVFFENEDISLYLQTDNKTGIIRAVAIPKTKKTTILIHEKTIRQNDVNTNLNIKSRLKTKTDDKTTNNSKHIVDHTNPPTIGRNIYTISIVLILVVFGVLIYFSFKRFNLLSSITKLIKKLF